MQIGQKAASPMPTFIFCKFVINQQYILFGFIFNIYVEVLRAAISLLISYNSFSFGIIYVYGCAKKLCNSIIWAKVKALDLPDLKQGTRISESFCQSFKIPVKGVVGNLNILHYNTGICCMRHYFTNILIFPRNLICLS